MNTDVQTTESRDVEIERLPQDLTEDILCLLPVKDLFRFRSVCKSWKALVDSYSFKMKQFQVARRSPPTFLLLRYMYDNMENSYALHFVSPNDPCKLSVTIPLHLGQFLDSTSTTSKDHNAYPYDFKFGVMNGLVCLVYEPCLVIWNPSTKEFRRIDLPPFGGLREHLKTRRCDLLGSILNVISAFGFDPKSEDYKFVTMEFTKSRKANLEIYSIRCNSWKRFTIDFPYVLPGVRTSDAYLDGKFYWSVKSLYKAHNASGYAIIRFDFSNEKLELIPLPSEDFFGLRYSVVVTTRGRLELFATFETSNSPRHCEVWVMEEDGTWSGTLSFGLPQEALIPRGIWKDDHIVFQSKINDLGCSRTNSLVDPSTGVCKNLEHDSTAIWVFSYVESLISVYHPGSLDQQ